MIKLESDQKVIQNTDEIKKYIFHCLNLTNFCNSDMKQASPLLPIKGKELKDERVKAKQVFDGIVLSEEQDVLSESPNSFDTK